MKKKMIAAAGILAAAFLLAACTRSDTDTASAGTGAAASSGESGSATAAQNSSPDTVLAGGTAAGAADSADPVITVVADDGSQSTAPAAEGSSQPAQPAADSSQQADASASADSQSGLQQDQTTDTQDTTVEITLDPDMNAAADAASSDEDLPTYDEVNQSGEDPEDTVDADGTYDAVNQSGAAQDAVSWAGVYDRDDGEMLTIHHQENGTFFFRFELCQIAGTAVIDSENGAAALYQGDDDNNIVFAISDEVISVSVTNSNGDDTSEAAMTGTYELSDDEE